MAPTDEISDLLRRHPVIDGHNDLLWELRDLVGYDFDRYDVGQRQTQHPYRPAAAAGRAAWARSSGRCSCRPRRASGP